MISSQSQVCQSCSLIVLTLGLVTEETNLYNDVAVELIDGDLDKIDCERELIDGDLDELFILTRVEVDEEEELFVAV